MLPSACSATKRVAPLGESARPVGSDPTSIVAVTSGAGPSMPSTRTTVASARLATNAVCPSGWRTTEEGAAPTLTRASRWLSAVVNDEIEPSWGLTITTMASSSLTTMVLERDERASTAFVVCPPSVDASSPPPPASSPPPASGRTTCASSPPPASSVPPPPSHPPSAASAHPSAPTRAVKKAIELRRIQSSESTSCATPRVRREAREHELTPVKRGGRGPLPFERAAPPPASLPRESAAPDGFATVDPRAAPSPRGHGREGV